MQYRVVIHVTVHGRQITLTSDPIESIDEADQTLDAIKSGLQFDISRYNDVRATGGDIQQHVPGVGWVLEDEAESTAILHRQAESDRDDIW